MGLFSSARATDLHPDVLTAAAHELGHAACHIHHSIRVISVSLNPSTGTGVTTIDLPDDEDTFTEHQWRAWLISSRAGWEAEVLWTGKHGGHPSRAACEADFANFRKYRRRAGLSESAASSAARRIVRANWRHIERYAPRLVVDGRITPSW